jgi:hypothetical protein
MNFVRPAALVLALATPAAAQYAQRADPRQTRAGSGVTATDIQRLQDQVYDTSNEISRMRSRDQSRADLLQSRLDDARDEVIYLRVKLRREGTVPRNTYDDVRLRVESIRNEVRTAPQQTNRAWDTPPPNNNRPGDTGYGNNPNPPYSGSPNSPNWPTGTGGQNAPRRNEVPSGTEIDVRLERELGSGTTQVEDRFTATTLADLYNGNDVLIPAGSTLRGVVSSVSKATRTDRKGSMTVAFDQITINGRSYPIHATVSQALESEGIRGEVGKIGAGAGVGAILGGILGGAKGALLGILIGGGGTIAATEGKDVTLPAGTVLRVRFEQPLMVR